MADPAFLNVTNRISLLPGSQFSSIGETINMVASATLSGSRLTFFMLEMGSLHYVVLLVLARGTRSFIYIYTICR